MAKEKKVKGRKKRVSPLGVLLIICMLLLAAVTLCVNVFFRDGKIPKIKMPGGGEYLLCYYTQEDMPNSVPSGTFVKAEVIEAYSKDQFVLYESTTGEYHIARIGALEAVSTGLTDSPLYNLYNEKDADPIKVTRADLLGQCVGKNGTLGVLIGFLLGTTGVLVGLVLPCLILLLYLIAAVVAAKESEEDAEDETEEDDDTDLAFVKSIQKKQQQIAERDAERMAKHGGEPEQKKQQTRKRLTDEEIAAMEEQEAARRAERIAAVRSHMEQRRQSDTPDGVPLYTTEIITKTHTMQIPKTGELTITRQQPAVRPTATGSIPRPAATGSFSRPASGDLRRTASRPAVKPETAAQEPAPQEIPAAVQPAAQDPNRPKATYEELMSMLDNQIKKLTKD